ncbi:MAG: hypothetical protein AAGF11_53310 [Myxococcota bacterium]
MASPARIVDLLLVLPLVASLGGCTDPASEGDGGSGDGNLPPPMEDADPLVVPTDSSELLEWLVAEPYLEWPSESEIHASAGPHFGNVRTWLHPDLVASLDAGNEQHPAGVAAIKELYGDGDSRGGWAVEVKLADDSAGGDNWYWYELFDGSTFADGNGVAICTSCHMSGMDYVRTPFPLQ